MRDTLLEHMILRILSYDIEEKPMRQSVLAAEVDIQIEHHELTYNDFNETLNRLETLGLISRTKDLLNYTRWKITAKGIKALREIVLGITAQAQTKDENEAVNGIQH